MLSDLSKNKVAVCVTGQKDCDRLINAGRELADSIGSELIVMSAMPRLYDGETARVLEYLYSCSAAVGAQMLVIYSDHAMEALIEGFKKHNVGHVLLGTPRYNSSQMAARLAYAYPSVQYMHSITVRHVRSGEQCRTHSDGTGKTHIRNLCVYCECA